MKMRDSRKYIVWIDWLMIFPNTFTLIPTTRHFKIKIWKYIPNKLFFGCKEKWYWMRFQFHWKYLHKPHQNSPSISESLSSQSWIFDAKTRNLTLKYKIPVVFTKDKELFFAKIFKIKWEKLPWIVFLNEIVSRCTTMHNAHHKERSPEKRRSLIDNWTGKRYSYLAQV